MFNLIFSENGSVTAKEVEMKASEFQLLIVRGFVRDEKFRSAEYCYKFCNRVAAVLWEQGGEEMLAYPNVAVLTQVADECMFVLTVPVRGLAVAKKLGSTVPLTLKNKCKECGMKFNYFAQSIDYLGCVNDLTPRNEGYWKNKVPMPACEAPVLTGVERTALEQDIDAALDAALRGYYGEKGAA